MKISVDSIGPEGFDLARCLPVEWLAPLLVAEAGTDADLTRGDHRPLQPATLRGRLRREQATVHLRGSLEARLEGPCSRCLEPVAFDVTAPLEQAFVPQAPAVAAGGELDAETLNTTVYTGKQIDLSELLRDELLLQLPMQLLCRSDCAGLCSLCGNNRNQGDRACGDAAAPPAPRGGLQQLTLR